MPSKKSNNDNINDEVILKKLAPTRRITTKTKKAAKKNLKDKVIEELAALDNNGSVYVYSSDYFDQNNKLSPKYREYIGDIRCYNCANGAYDDDYCGIGNKLKKMITGSTVTIDNKRINCINDINCTDEQDFISIREGHTGYRSEEQLDSMFGSRFTNVPIFTLCGGDYCDNSECTQWVHTNCPDIANSEDVCHDSTDD